MLKLNDLKKCEWIPHYGPFLLLGPTQRSYSLKLKITIIDNDQVKLILCLNRTTLCKISYTYNKMK